MLPLERRAVVNVSGTVDVMCVLWLLQAGSGCVMCSCSYCTPCAMYCVHCVLCTELQCSAHCVLCPMSCALCSASYVLPHVSCLLHVSNAYLMPAVRPGARDGDTLALPLLRSFTWPRSALLPFEYTVRILNSCSPCILKNLIKTNFSSDPTRTRIPRH